MTDRADEPTPSPQPPKPLPKHSTPADAPDERDHPEMDRADRANGEPDADDGGPGPGS